jgi:hypothetical protein
MNAAFPITDDPREVFASADVGALADTILKMAAEKVMTTWKIEDARIALLNKITDILNAVKTIYQTGQNPQLLLPESLHLLPLVILAINKTPAIRPGATIPSDVRSYYLALVKTLPTDLSISLLYPFLFALHSLPDAVSFFRVYDLIIENILTIFLLRLPSVAILILQMTIQLSCHHRYIFVVKSLSDMDFTFCTTAKIFTSGWDLKCTPNCAS